MNLPLFTDTSGKKSVSLTMMVVAFTILMLWMLLSIVEEIAGIPIRDFSGTTAMEVLSPLLALYFSRRWTDAKVGMQAQLESSKNSEEEG